MTTTTATWPVARHGGEEFALVLPQTGLAQAEAVAERVRSELEALAEPHAVAPGGIVTVSVGVTAVAPSRGDTVEDLVHAADARLFGRVQLATMLYRWATPASGPTYRQRLDVPILARFAGDPAADLAGADPFQRAGPAPSEPGLGTAASVIPALTPVVHPVRETVGTWKNSPVCQGPAGARVVAGTAVPPRHPVVMPRDDDPAGGGS